MGHEKSTIVRINWNTYCASKEAQGLNLINLKEAFIALSNKWIIYALQAST